MQAKVAGKRVEVSQSSFRVLSIGCVGMALLLGAVLGCGGGVRGGGGCEDSEAGQRVLLRNSGLACSEALGIQSLLGAESTRPQRISSDHERDWICVGFGERKYPVINRCYQDKRHFDIVETGR